MNWIALLFALELGIMPMGYLETYERVLPVQHNLDGAYYVDMQADVLLYDLFFIGGRTKTYMRKRIDVLSFWPTTAEFEFNAGIRAGILEIGFRHYCMHPIVPWLYHGGGAMQWEGGYEELYIRLESKEFRSKK